MAQCAHILRVELMNGEMKLCFLTPAKFIIVQYTRVQCKPFVTG